MQGGPGSRSRQRNRGSIQSMPELDTSFVGGERGRGLKSHDTLSVFDLLSYTDVDTGQREEFQFLLDRVSMLLLLFLFLLFCCFLLIKADYLITYFYIYFLFC